MYIHVSGQDIISLPSGILPSSTLRAKVKVKSETKQLLPCPRQIFQKLQMATKWLQTTPFWTKIGLPIQRFREESEYGTPGVHFQVLLCRNGKLVFFDVVGAMALLIFVLPCC